MTRIKLEPRMSITAFGSELRRSLFGGLALALVFALTPVSTVQALTQAQTQSRAPSSAEERARFVSITHRLEAAPLQPEARADRAWALQWLVDVPDVSVNVCLDYLGGLKRDYPYAGEITLQYTFATAVYKIENPERTDDRFAQLAGVESALSAYRAILRVQPQAKSPALDALLDAQTRGGLSGFIVSASGGCSASN
ncbi:MAG: hypothetical protein EBR82_28660 [Caulobacteraceae bacterium]|nr:hypothetical protein [Caulobacteraceae bacterium]